MRINCRQANINDLNLYLTWANDKDVRANSIHTEPISLENHTQWFKQKLTSTNTYLFIFEVSAEALGQVRFDIENGIALIDFSIDSKQRNKGLGLQIIKQAIVELLSKTDQVLVIKAQVLSSNQPSAKVFEKLKFIQGVTQKIDDRNFIDFTLDVSQFHIPYVIANVNTSLVRAEENALKKSATDFYLIHEHEQLAEKILQILKPKFIFFFHWSHIIPATIYEDYNCVVFHMTDLPYGRGGSPLQNLIVNGHKQTKISAIQVVEALDAGSVYLKQSLDLSGTAEEIFIRAADVIERMMYEIINHNIKPVAQEGEPVIFKRRKPADGNIANLTDLEKVYDYIRMLDAPGYPNAFIETETLKIEFSKASLQSDNTLLANVKIIKK